MKLGKQRMKMRKQKKIVREKVVEMEDSQRRSNIYI